MTRKLYVMLLRFSLYFYLLLFVFVSVLKEDEAAAEEFLRIKGRIFIASLAGRKPTKDELLNYFSEADRWRTTCMTRIFTDVLGKHGLTTHRYREILSRACDVHTDVRKLRDDWGEFFKSEKHNLKWKDLVNPFKNII